MYGFKIIVEGDYACFTRPEMKVERVSYDVPTPSAMEGLLKSIYWKPAIRYVIDEIVVFNPISFVNIRRNEIKDKILFSNVKACLKGNAKDLSIYTSESRSQRATMLLKDVKYGIKFHFELTGNKCENEENSNEKHYNIIKRRIENGQHFRTPCLGCSEFTVKKFKLVDDFNLAEVDNSLMGDTDLGFMLYGMRFLDTLLFLCFRNMYLFALKSYHHCYIHSQ